LGRKKNASENSQHAGFQQEDEEGGGKQEGGCQEGQEEGSRNEGEERIDEKSQRNEESEGGSKGKKLTKL
jgi:hypothetical protein